MKQGSEHIPFLDHLRGVAILSVFLFHCLMMSIGQPYFGPNAWFRTWSVFPSSLVVFPAAFGWLGVPMFFAISGFCIHLSHQRSRYKGFTVFFLRRFFRIYPPYLVALMLVVLSIVVLNLGFHVVSVRGTTLSDIMGQVVPHLFLIHNLSGSYAQGLNSALWSVAVEAQLYLLYPVLLWWASRWSWMNALWMTAFFELGLRTFEAVVNLYYPGWHAPQIYDVSPFGFWFSWAIGAALADAYLKGTKLPFRNSFVFIWPVLFVGCYFFRPLFCYDFTLAALSTTALIAFGLGGEKRGWRGPGWTRYPLEHLRQAGIISYSAYLLHVPLLSQIPRVVIFIFYPHVIAGPAMFGICVCAWLPVFGLSYLFYKYIELPSIAWGKAIIARRELPPSELALKAKSADLNFILQPWQSESLKVLPGASSFIYRDCLTRPPSS